MTKTTNNMKRTILIGMLSVTMLAQTKAQHFYYKLDVGTSNIYSFAIFNIATAWLNKLTNTMLFDNAYTYTHLNTTGQADRYKTRNYDVTGDCSAQRITESTNSRILMSNWTGTCITT